MVGWGLHRGMGMVERTFHELAGEYAVPIAELHWVLDGTDEQCPYALCFYLQGDGGPYSLEFTARQLVAVAAHQGADRSHVESLVREKLQALMHQHRQNKDMV